jgi:hypothetical protein
MSLIDTYNPDFRFMQFGCEFSETVLSQQIIDIIQYQGLYKLDKAETDFIADMLVKLADADAKK